MGRPSRRSGALPSSTTSPTREYWWPWRREGNRPFYDLPERVLPARLLKAPEPKLQETERWLARLKLRQRRLAVLRRDEVQALGNEAQPVRVPGCPLLHCLRADVPLLECIVSEGSEGGAIVTGGCSRRSIR